MVIMARKRVRIKIKRKGWFKERGYDPDYSKEYRRRVLRRLVRRYGYGTIIKKLNAVAVLNKYRNPKYARIFRSDMRYLQKRRERR